MAGEPLPALTLHAPYAYGVAHLGKKLENRGRRPPARLIGHRLAIHAGAKNPDDEWRQIARIVGGDRIPVEPPPRMTVVAVVTLWGWTESFSTWCTADKSMPRLGTHTPAAPWWIGPVGWLLSDVVTLPTPVPCKGRQGLWSLPPDVDAQVREQLARARAT